MFGCGEKVPREAALCVKKLTSRTDFLHLVFQNKKPDDPENIDEKEKMADGIIDTDTNQYFQSQ